MLETNALKSALSSTIKMLSQDCIRVCLSFPGMGC